MSRLAIWHTQYQFDLVSRFCHVSLCFVSEVWTCRWDQNPEEFAAVPGVHWPSSRAFRDREVFAGRWLENLRYLPEVSVLQLNSSFFFKFGQWLKNETIQSIHSLKLNTFQNSKLNNSLPQRKTKMSGSKRWLRPRRKTSLLWCQSASWNQRLSEKPSSLTLGDF